MRQLRKNEDQGASQAAFERRAIQAKDRGSQRPGGRTPGPSEGQERAPAKGPQEARVGEVRERSGP